MRSSAIILSLLLATPAFGAELGGSGPRSSGAQGSATSEARGRTESRGGAASGKATAASGAKRDSGVSATVRTDGAMIYSKPDFDADILGNLRRGDRVRVSSGTLGEYAKFHKVAAGAVVGWIADIDVQVDGAVKKRDHKRGAKKNAKAAREPREKKPVVDESLPIFFSKYLGVLIGFSEFNESISGVDARDTLLFYGLKFTGPDILLTGPVIDFNLALHYGAPGYYAPLSSTKPSGFILQTDALLLYPFFNRDKAMITFGIGPLVKFSTFSVTSGGDIKSLSQLDLGASFALSGAIKIGKIALRLEGKYLLEKHQEKMVQFALQQQF